MNVHEALKNIDVSSEDDIFGDDSFISKGRLVVLSPNNEGDRANDEYSGAENELLLNALNRSQLIAGATINLAQNRQLETH